MQPPYSPIQPPVLAPPRLQPGMPGPLYLEPVNSVWAVASLILGIGAWLTLPGIGAILAVVFGHIGRREIRRDPAKYKGMGLTVAGLALGYAQIALIAALATLVIVSLAVSQRVP